ncbi:uncharacterized protein PV06_10641 [Exophiala oligosperma]|uniref:mRNA stability protein n=1 Tax=Exophiala oligosperma TaxID=215243 RepID=A0A0D2AAB0_9EURO|nr:uncharacterized protein PV06_10641 [Exophiala oligosperma]KIW37301.1 hypothetical protein PV06_10641 [Exophiala oligosperma]
MSQRVEESNEAPTEREREVYARYETLTKQNILLRSQVKERKFFDSGDLAISKATDDSMTGHPRTGKQHPISGEIPKLSSPMSGDSNVKSHANTAHDQNKTKE